MKTSKLILIALMVVLSACSAKIEGEAVEEQDQPNNPQNTIAAKFNGVWTTGCMTTNNFFYSNTTVELNNGQYKMSNHSYKDSACTVRSLEPIVEQGYVILGGDDLSSVLPIDLHANKGPGVWVIYRDIVLLEEGRFYMGDPKSRDPATNRPTKIDTTRPFIKQ